MNSGTLIGGLDLAQRFKKELVALHYRWFGSHRFQILVISKLIGIFIFFLILNEVKKKLKILQNLIWFAWIWFTFFGYVILHILNSKVFKTFAHF